MNDRNDYRNASTVTVAAVLLAAVILIALLIVNTARGGVRRLLKPMQNMQHVMGARVARRPPALNWYRQVLFGFQHPPHLRQLLCIHYNPRVGSGEGSWTDPAPPYFGGLQMDLGFQRAYGGWLLRWKGTADHWTPLEQIWTAEKAVRRRGFWPWPNTARTCGLLP